MYQELSQENSEVLKKKADDFEELKRSDWSNEILIVAHQNLQARRRNKSPLLPLAEDIRKMTKHAKLCEMLDLNDV